MDRQSTGRRGEELAAQFLRQKGYRIHETNFRCPPGEIDIVASDGGTLVFVEVRTRRGELNVEEMVPPRKQRKVRDVAMAYLQARYGSPDTGHPAAELGPSHHRAKPAKPSPPQPVRPAKRAELPPCRIDVVIVGLGPDGSAKRVELIRDAIQE